MKKLQIKMKRKNKKRCYWLMASNRKVGAVSMASMGTSHLTRNVWITKVKTKMTKELKRIKE